MVACIAFIIGLLVGGIVCLFGVALVASGERLEYTDGYTDGYNDRIKEENHHD